MIRHFPIFNFIQELQQAVINNFNLVLNTTSGKVFNQNLSCRWLSFYHFVIRLFVGLNMGRESSFATLKRIK